MSAVQPIRDGAFPFDPRMIDGARSDPARAASLLGAETLPAQVDLPVWCYLIRTEAGPGLVDTGGGALMGAGFGALGGALAEAGVAPHQITRIWLTHLHADHCGGLLTAEGGAAFARARIAVGAGERAFWRARDLPQALEPIAREARAALAPYAGRIDAVHPGALLDGAEAVAAPGHTPGHLAWAFPALGVLAAGDIVHLGALQLADPGWSTDWDLDVRAATATRRALIARAQAQGLALLTGHAGRIDVGPR